MDPIILEVYNFMDFFQGIVLLPSKKEYVRITHYDFKKKVIGFCLTVMFWTFLAAMSFYLF